MGITRLIDGLPPHFPDDAPDIYYVGSEWSYLIHQTIERLHTKQGQAFSCEVCERWLLFPQSLYMPVDGDEYRKHALRVSLIHPYMEASYHNHVVTCGACYDARGHQSFIQWALTRYIYLAELFALVRRPPYSITRRQLAYELSGVDERALPRPLCLALQYGVERQSRPQLILNYLNDVWVVEDYHTRFRSLDAAERREDAPDA